VKLLETSDLVKIYSKRYVVDHVGFEVHSGEIVGLLGPNGAGKTTAFRMTIGMITANSGKVMFNGKDVTNLPMYKRARAGMGYLAQEPSVFQRLTVEENVLAILETLKISRAERKRRLEELLNELGLARLAKSKAYQLSGGERRRLEITRALVTSPSLLLLDEPFSGVDPIAVEDIRHIIVDLRDRKLGILITDHNVRETLAVTDRSYILNMGKILRSGTPDELVNDAEVRKIYLGETISAADIHRAQPPRKRGRLNRLTSFVTGHPASAPKPTPPPETKPEPPPATPTPVAEEPQPPAPAAAPPPVEKPRPEPPRSEERPEPKTVEPSESPKPIAEGPPKPSPPVLPKEEKKPEEDVKKPKPKEEGPPPKDDLDLDGGLKL